MGKASHHSDFTKRNAAIVLAGEIERLEQLAHQADLTLTAQALNRAKNVVGWQAAGDDECAALVMNGERPK